MHEVTGELITATITNFSRITGIARSKSYEFIASGNLASFKIGKRRLMDSYHRLIEQQRAGEGSK